MRFLRVPLIAFAAISLAGTAHARAVISEVNWAGSDLSASDEWVELSGPGSGSGDESLAGWTLTSVNSSGVEVVLFTFPAGAIIQSGELLIVSHFASAQSRLLAEPAFITTAISLPNTKLLLRLRDAAGQIIDQVDDGVGNPFAGSNGTSKASMERVDLSAAGDDPNNWMTASSTSGFDEGAAMFGTPGFPRAIWASPASSVSSIAQSSSSSAIASSSSSCASPDPYFIMQSGATTGVGKVTLNVQLGARTGSLSSAACSVDFDDGTISPSCNPPSHTYDEPGSYVISAIVKSSCGATAQASLNVTVTATDSSTADPDTDQRSTGGPSTEMGEDLSSDRWSAPGGPAFAITGVLPNPAGKDPGNEWVEIRNISDQTAALDGWSLRLPHAKKSSYTFGSVGFFLHETKRFSDRDLGMTFGNASGDLSLVNPAGEVVSIVSWKDAREGVTQRPEQTIKIIGPIKGRVLHVIDGDTFDVQIEGTSRTERVRLIGVDAPELHSSDPRQTMLAKRAAEFLRDRIDGETLTLTTGTDDRDSYGRLLVYATDEAGDSVQETLLKEGLVIVYLRFQFAKESEYIGYQREAQDANAGMWGLLQASPITLASVLLSPDQGVQRIQRVQGPEPTFIAAVFSSESSSSKKSSSPKKSSSSKSSSSKKKKAAPSAPKSAPAYEIITEDDVQEESVNDGPNFSAMSDDQKDLWNLVQEPEEIGEAEVESLPQETSYFPFVLIGLLGAVGGSVIAWVASRFFSRL